jgi:hypothetical protein
MSATPTTTTVTSGPSPDGDPTLRHFNSVEAAVRGLAARVEDIEKERVTWKGYGESKPLVPNTNEANRAINRRVEFRVIER